MEQFTSTMSSKGQVTIPAEVRKRLGLHTGDTLTFVADTAGRIELRSARFPTVASLEGAAGTLREPLEWGEVEGIVREERADAILRKRRDGA